MTEQPGQRLPNGQWAPGASGGRNGGRKRKAASADEALEQAFSETISITEGGRKRKVRKLDATAKQIANEGATGKNARLALAALQKAADRKQQGTPTVEVLTESDQQIWDRFFEAHRQFLMEGGVQ